jgi:NAD(P)-dependent dehydrogenase (short-subunit alcohol dehydrogenase family)
MPKPVLITGASSGLGKDASLLFKSKVWKTFINTLLVERAIVSANHTDRELKKLRVPL